MFDEQIRLLKQAIHGDLVNLHKHRIELTTCLDLETGLLLQYV